MLRLSVSHEDEFTTSDHSEGPIIIGRVPQGTHTVKIGDRYVSRNQLSVQELDSSQIEIKNLSQQVPAKIVIPGPEQTLGPGETRVCAAPIRIRVGRSLINVDVDFGSSSGGAFATISPSRRNIALGTEGFSLGRSPNAETLVGWFETLISVQRAAAGSDEFFNETAQAVVQLIGLDVGMVVLREDNAWRTVGAHVSNPEIDVQISRSVLERVCMEQQTVYQNQPSELATESLSEVSAVVASPVFDENEEDVVGVVYGARVSEPTVTVVAAAVTPLEAQLVQVLAAAVGVGLARQRREEEATRLHVQFEQFVSPQVARELERDPTLLDGRDRPVTVLFADIRNFSQMSESIGADNVCRLVGSIMDVLGNRVIEFGGTTVSYLGDGLLAMWNAPVSQEDHATAACRAALAMLDDLPTLNEQWAGVTRGALGIGIGINTGTAMVGNTGSKFKPHYGPLGHTVNLASRVEGATKKLGVPILITGATQNELEDDFATRRLCRVRVLGIQEPVELYELRAENREPEWEQRCQAYETALGLFEASRFSEACAQLMPLIDTDSDNLDHPSLSLVSRTVECLKSPPEDFDPVWDFFSK